MKGRGEKLSKRVKGENCEKDEEEGDESTEEQRPSFFSVVSFPNFSYENSITL